MRDPGVVTEQTPHHGNRIIWSKRRQVDLPAARPDGGQEAARNVRNQKEQCPLGWLFKDLQQCIGGIGIHVIDRVDNADPPSAFAGGVAEEPVGLAHFINGKRRLELFGLAVPRPPQNQQTGMAQRRDPSGDGIIRIDIQGVDILGNLIAILEGKPRHTVGERRLADALRPADDPGMMKPPLPASLQKLPFRRFVALQFRPVTRMRKTFENIAFGDLAIHHRPSSTRKPGQFIGLSAGRRRYHRSRRQ